MKTFHVTFIDAGNCEIFETDVEVECFSDAIEQAFFKAGQAAADGEDTFAVLSETKRITVEAQP